MFPFIRFPGLLPHGGIVFPGFVAQACCNPCCKPSAGTGDKPCSCRGFCRLCVMCPCQQTPPAPPARPEPRPCSCGHCHSGGYYPPRPQPPCPCHQPPAPIWPPRPQPGPCSWL
jgi:hypothetical protein